MKDNEASVRKSNINLCSHLFGDHRRWLTAATQGNRVLWNVTLQHSALKSIPLLVLWNTVNKKKLIGLFPLTSYSSSYLFKFTTGVKLMELLNDWWGDCQGSALMDEIPSMQIKKN